VGRWSSLGPVPSFRARFPSIDGDVLRVLAGRPDDFFTAGMVQRASGRNSVAGVRRVLNRLVDQGIVHREPDGPVQIYSLNADHLAASQLISLARLRLIFLDLLTVRLSEWDPCPRFAALTGTAATGPMAATDPIELFVVHGECAGFDVDEWSGPAEPVSLGEVIQLTGNELRVDEYDHDRVCALRAARSELVRDVADRGLVVLGPSDYLIRSLPNLRGEQ
jgi:hypothetical protein